MPKNRWTRGHNEAEVKPAHRSIEEIRRDMGNTPAQGLASLQAELEAAERELQSQPAEPSEEE